MRSRLLTRLRPGRGEEGYALLTVVAAIFVLTILATGALGYALNGVKGGKKDSDWNASLAAAQAGVDDFLAKVRADEGYWRKTPQYAVANPTAAASVDCANVALRVPISTNAPCGWNASTPVGWRTVGSSTTASFHYDVDVTSTQTNGMVKLTSTGRVGKVTRTVTSQVKRQGFGEFLYLSDYETIDPANRAVYASDAAAADAQRKCSQHYYEPDQTLSPPAAPRNASCPLISFSGNDRINGPLHSNDTISISGSATFNGATTTSYPACAGKTGKPNCYINPPGISGTPSRSPTFRPVVSLPTTVAGLKSKTDATAENPGCLYTGPTRIVFTADGKMKVWSPYTRSVNAHCGRLSQLNNAAGAGDIIDVPTNSLIYVQDVPATEAVPAAGACAPDSIAPKFPLTGDFNMVDVTWPVTTKVTHTKPSGKWRITTKKTYTEPAGADPATSVVTTTKDVTTDPGTAPADVVGTETHKPLGVEAQCRTGTAYVEGSLNGKVTLVADNSIIVADHLTYSDGHAAPSHTGHGQSVLGLIASNSVLVYHPITCRRGNVNADGVCTNGTNLARHTGTVFQDPKIHASILTLQHSIAVQAYQLGGPLGTLSIFGSMAQRFRGAVATGSGSTTSTGYQKGYSFDENLKFDPPPHFLDPTSGGWGSTRYAEVTAAYAP
jgi:Tfp pilus assembly protein PilX